MSFVKGDRVRTTDIIERWPHFKVPSGSMGTVTYSESDGMHVRFDKPIPGCEDWCNEVIWCIAEGEWQEDDHDCLELVENALLTVCRPPKTDRVTVDIGEYWED